MMDELYDCHHSAVGFVVPGRCFTYPGAKPKVPVGKVAINALPDFGFGTSSGSLVIGRVRECHSRYYADSPRFLMRAASPAQLQQHMKAVKGGCSLELPPRDFEDMELAIGRGVCDYEHPRQFIASCEMEYSFDRKGLFVCFTGQLEPSGKVDPSLLSERYCAEASIEWRVLRFLFGIYFVKAMYSKVTDHQPEG